MLQARRIGHATFETPDLDRQIGYYTGILGLSLAAREPRRACLATRLGQVALVLEEGPHARCTGTSFQLDPATDFADIVRELAEHGIAAEERADTTPGIARSVVFQDPKGTAIELFTEAAMAATDPAIHGIMPLKLGHLAFHVPDPLHIVEYYRTILGFRVSDWIGDYFAFMRCGPDHHTLNFLPGDIHMQHIAYELKDWAHLQLACDELGRHRIPIIWGPGRHGVGHNIFTYHRDPDGHIIELYCELDQMKDEALGCFDPRPWHKDRPQRPKVWQRDDARLTWGPPPTDDFMRGRKD